VGFFGTYRFDGQAWHEFQLGEAPDIPEPWLVLDIHDSDIGTVLYRPTGPGSGVAYLGTTPRVYFEIENDEARTDPQREANGLATWWELIHGRHAEATERDAKAAELLTYLAGDVDLDLDDSDDDVDLDDGDVFVEIKAARLLVALGLPILDDLPAPE
jgi:hypothetical protein